MKTIPYLLALLLALGVFLGGNLTISPAGDVTATWFSVALADDHDDDDDDDDQEPVSECTYNLNAVGDALGWFLVDLEEDELEIEVSGADPNTLYTVWFNFSERPLDSQGVAPAFATTAGVFEGMRMDVNGFMTDSDGDAEFKAELDYNLLQPGDAPVVFQDNTFDPLRDLDKQGMNRVGGHWKRVYQVGDYNAAASLQLTSPHTRRPQVERGTAKGIVIAQHFDFITHGHTPGVFNVDFFVPFSGDFPPECLP